MKITISDLRARQQWSLNQKIDHAVDVLDAFFRYCKEHGKTPYVSFSGGKDSTVLLDLARRFIDPNTKAVFCNTSNEYPEIIRFVRQTENVTMIRPAMTFKQVVAKYGFPLVSKEQALAVRQIKTTRSDKLREYRLHGNGEQKSGTLSKKWRYLIDEPYMTSEKCCDVLKKRPFAKHQKENNALPILGTMADESLLRQSNYVRQGGCNSFNENPAKSKCAPLSIWIEKDIWDYIHRFKIPYCPIYDVPGVERTGCAACGFGAQYREDARYRILSILHPKIYDLVMNYTNNGVTLRTALRRMGVALPDENRTLF